MNGELLGLAAMGVGAVASIGAAVVARRTTRPHRNHGFTEIEPANETPVTAKTTPEVAG